MSERRKREYDFSVGLLRADLRLRARTAGEQRSREWSTVDPLSEVRDIRVPAEGIRSLGLPSEQEEPPPIGPTEEKLGWFEVTVVDAWGAPVGGLDLEISHAGTRKKLRTPANGKVRVEGVSASFGSVRFVDVPAARDVVRPRWVKKPPESAPEVDNPAVVALSPDMGAISLTSEKPSTIVLVRPLPRVRLIGMHFDTNKSFMRPTAVRGIRAVVAEFEKSPTGNLLIVGHTDSVGPDWENLDLSVDRAEAVKAYLKNDVHAWEVWYGEGKEFKTRWGDRETMQMLSALPCAQSIAGFQAFSNETRSTSLAVDGIFGPVTRHELIKAYMELGGTTLPEHIGIAVHGCGELFPAEDVGDQVEDQENRRVEMFCFDDKIDPPVPGKKAKKGEPEYPQWSTQVTKDVDVDTAPQIEIIVRLTDEDHDPLPGGSCRVLPDGAPTQADDGGLARLSVPAGTVSFDLEWQPSQDRSFVRRVFVPTNEDSSDEACARRLRHLGFEGGDLAALTRSFQRYFRDPLTGRIADIRDELVVWHDGGLRPKRTDA